MGSIAGNLRLAAYAGVPLLLAGCVDQAYVYTPAEQATATMNGRLAARYEIPPGAPRGDVRIASFGVVDIEQPRRPDADEIAALHVRFAVSNDAGAGPWTVDTRRIQADLRGVGDAGVPMVASDADGLPTVTIEPGQQRVIDLFYPLPRNVEGEDDMPAFDLLWRVRTDTGLVTQRTPFERIDVERQTPTYSATGWYGSFWWYHPWYYPPGVIVRPGVLVAPGAPPPRVIVRSHPRGR